MWIVINTKLYNWFFFFVLDCTSVDSLNISELTNWSVFIKLKTIFTVLQMVFIRMICFNSNWEWCINLIFVAVFVCRFLLGHILLCTNVNCIDSTCMWASYLFFTFHIIFRTAFALNGGTDIHIKCCIKKFLFFSWNGQTYTFSVIRQCSSYDLCKHVWNMVKFC